MIGLTYRITCKFKFVFWLLSLKHWRMNNSCYRVSKQVLEWDKRRKISWKFVYILAKQYRTPFNLTNFLDKKKHFDIFILGRFRSKTCWDILYYSLNARMIRQKSQSLHERTYLRFRISKFLEDVLNSSFCFDDFDNFGTWNSQLKEE